MRKEILILIFLALGSGNGSFAAQFPPALGATRAPAIEVDRNDSLYLVMSVATSPSGTPHSQIFFTMSTDGGATWDNLPKTRNLSNSPGEAFGPSIAITRAGKIRAFIAYHDNTPGPTQVFFINSKKRARFRQPVNITPPGAGAFSPKVALDSNNNIYVVWGGTQGGGRSVIFTRSTDGGSTFTQPKEISDSAGAAFDPEIAVDQSDAIDVVWEGTGPGHSAIMFSRSTDGGDTFSNPKVVSLGSNDAFEPHIAIDRSGGINITWVEAAGGGSQLMFARSTNGGSTFSAPLNITSAPGADVHKPFIETFRDTIYIAYQDDSQGQVFLIKSEDGGLSFSRPVQVSQANPRFGRGHSPAMATDSHGRLHIVWIDSSILGRDEGLLFYTSTTDGRDLLPQRMILAAL
jgi:hypothetical protein